MEIDIIHILAEKFDFKMNFSFATLGNHKVDGRWIGRVGKLIYEQADFGVGSLVYYHGVWSHLDFSTYLYQFRFMFCSRIPVAVSNHGNIVR